MSDKDFTSADPWGLPVETEPQSVAESHSAPEAAPPPPAVEEPAEPESAQDTELTEDAPLVDTVRDEESEPDETPVGDLEGEEPDGLLVEEDIAEEDAPPEDFETELSADGEDISDDLPEEAAPMQPVSQAHSAARNVLDALGVGLGAEDLPEEPPAWMEEPAESVAAPPSIYQELASLGEANTDETALADDTEDVIEDEGGAAEEPSDEEHESMADLEDTAGNIVENLEEEADDGQDIAEQEPAALKEAVEKALSSIADGSELEDVTVDTADLDDAVEQAITNSDDTTEPLEDAIEQAITNSDDTTEPLEDAIEVAVSAAISEPGSLGDEAVAAVSWGSEWQDAAQGWVQQEGGRSTWRPIVTTTPEAGAWEIDTFLGLAAGDAALADVEHGVPAARNRAIRSMVDEALARGAHAVVGVKIEIQEIGGVIHVGAVGTAVTLRSSS